MFFVFLLIVVPREEQRECGLFCVVNNKFFSLTFSLYCMSLNCCILMLTLRSFAFNIIPIFIYCFVAFILFPYKEFVTLVFVEYSMYIAVCCHTGNI